VRGGSQRRQSEYCVAEFCVVAWSLTPARIAGTDGPGYNKHREFLQFCGTFH
jgi:hypothetical protein